MDVKHEVSTADRDPENADAALRKRQDAEDAETRRVRGPQRPADQVNAPAPVQAAAVPNSPTPATLHPAPPPAAPTPAPVPAPPAPAPTPTPVPRTSTRTP
ncbi:MAG: hypothetical protein ABI665_26720 [Vicinamibacterales bacterium]